MVRAHPFIANTPGLRFYRLLGSGAGRGFNPAPNLGVYAFLGLWENAAAAREFFANNEWVRQTNERTDHRIDFYLRATMSHGAWGGNNPFEARPGDYAADRPVAVLTRATINPKRLREFWSYVPAASASLEGRPERLLSVGIGEYPIFMQATFSVWQTGEAMTRFAYENEHHRRVVKLTRQRNWHKEELFTRFSIDHIEGAWPEFVPPEGYLSR